MKQNIPATNQNITRHDFFAAFALTGVLASESHECCDLSEMADTAFQLADLMLERAEDHDAIESEFTSDEPVPAPKPKKVKAPKVEEPAPAPKAEEPAPAPKPVEESFTVQDLRTEAQKALESGKSAEIVAINKEYGVKRISEVTPDLYPVIIKKLRAINGQA